MAYIIKQLCGDFQQGGCLWVIPYQFTKIMRITPLELDKIWCVGSPAGHMYPKGISPKLLIWLPRNGLLNILLFLVFSLHVII